MGLPLSVPHSLILTFMWLSHVVVTTDNDLVMMMECVTGDKMVQDLGLKIFQGCWAILRQRGSL